MWPSARAVLVRVVHLGKLLAAAEEQALFAAALLHWLDWSRNEGGRAMHLP